MLFRALVLLEMKIENTKAQVTKVMEIKVGSQAMAIPKNDNETLKRKATQAQVTRGAIKYIVTPKKKS